MTSATEQERLVALVDNYATFYNVDRLADWLIGRWLRNGSPRHVTLLELATVCLAAVATKIEADPKSVQRPAGLVAHMFNRGAGSRQGWLELQAELRKGEAKVAAPLTDDERELVDDAVRGDRAFRRQVAQDPSRDRRLEAIESWRRDRARVPYPAWAIQGYESPEAYKERNAQANELAKQRRLKREQEELRRRSEVAPVGPSVVRALSQANRAAIAADPANEDIDAGTVPEITEDVLAEMAADLFGEPEPKEGA